VTDTIGLGFTPGGIKGD